MMTAKEYRAMPKGKEKQHIELTLISLSLPYVCEYKFVPTRKFRADYAILMDDLKLLIEYDGLAWKGGKSRHTTVTGFTNDATKQNFATVLGYKVLKYTAKNYKNIYQDLKQIIDK